MWRISQYPEELLENHTASEPMLIHTGGHYEGQKTGHVYCGVPLGAYRLGVCSNGRAPGSEGPDRQRRGASGPKSF